MVARVHRDHFLGKGFLDQTVGVKTEAAVERAPSRNSINAFTNQQGRDAHGRDGDHPEYLLIQERPPILFTIILIFGRLFQRTKFAARLRRADTGAINIGIPGVVVAQFVLKTAGYSACDL
jgi:hypothetical protein